ncbi:hypothetical protein [Streptomyces sp. NPDC097610]|uniref:hypothetical protein n=1 Tax=Streptomyces sp. NPDC097610 TaxID=3157227 RepID=UPI00331C098B
MDASVHDFTDGEQLLIELAVMQWKLWVVEWTFGSLMQHRRLANREIIGPLLRKHCDAGELAQSWPRAAHR